MFLDVSAIVAILTREPEADAFADLLEAAKIRITSPMAIFEAAAICRKRHTSEEVTDNVRKFLAVAEVDRVPITNKEAETALTGFSRYGKGGGHQAQLNLGDCFAYSVAKNYRVPLLFKGNDFDKTDIESASQRS